MTKGLAFALGAQAIVLAVLLTFAADQYAHSQVEMVDGLNRWGYRGAVAKQRAADETRIVMAGGTRAFEPGVPVKDTNTARVRFMVEQWVTFDRGPVTAINLGLVGLPRGGYARRLEQFRYLAPDVICVYIDLAAARSAPPEPGLATRVAGYVPALPVLTTLDRQFGRLLGPVPRDSDDIHSIVDAVSVARSLAPTVVAVPEPQFAVETDDRDALIAALSTFTGDARVKMVQLEDGPPRVVAGVSQPAVAAQIEAAVTALLRARPAPAGGR